MQNSTVECRPVVKLGDFKATALEIFKFLRGMKIARQKYPLTIRSRSCDSGRESCAGIDREVHRVARRVLHARSYAMTIRDYRESWAEETCLLRNIYRMATSWPGPAVIRGCSLQQSSFGQGLAAKAIRHPCGHPRLNVIA